jgi:hypothetical protein
VYEAGIVVTAGIVLAYQLYVSLLVWRCKFYEPSQKRIQLLVIWILPVLDTVVCHAIVRTHGDKNAPIDSLVKHYDEVDEYGWPKSARRHSNSGGHRSTDEGGDGEE